LNFLFFSLSSPLVTSTRFFSLCKYSCMSVECLGKCSAITSHSPDAIISIRWHLLQALSSTRSIEWYVLFRWFPNPIITRFHNPLLIWSSMSPLPLYY
jgi:hypothetical protein